MHRTQSPKGRGLEILIAALARFERHQPSAAQSVLH